VIGIEQAKCIILQETKEGKCEKVRIEACLGRTLAEDIFAQNDLPPFDKSAMDGYALKSMDTFSQGENRPKQLTIKATIKAGECVEIPLKEGETHRIMTGAPIPEGADAVIEFEAVEEREGLILLSKPVRVGKNIIRQGEEIRQGERLLTKGSLVTPAEIGVLASQGYSTARVYEKPQAAVISTGDELISITDKLEKGKIRDCNSYLLRALLEREGARISTVKLITDEENVLVNEIAAAFEKADLVISSGGVSVGDCDYIAAVLKRMGAKIFFHSVAIKPGKPVIFAKYKNKLFFGLPGNPLAVATTFEELVRPVLRKMQGTSSWQDEVLYVVLKEEVTRDIKRTKYMYVAITNEKGVYYAECRGSQSSSHLMTYMGANGMIIIPQGEGKLEKGAVVDGRFIKGSK
jgi:molybdopterin molybdotransferase